MSHEELRRLSGEDPWVRWSVDPAMPGETWTDGRVLLVERRGRRRGFWVTRLRDPLEPAEVRAALTWLRDGGHLERLQSTSVSVEQQHLPIATELLDLAEGGDWEWMWTTTPPPRDPREADVVELDDRTDAPEILEFSQRHNPRVWTEIGAGTVTVWLGLRDPDGTLVAVGGSERDASGLPHLAGIVTATGLRGQGLGSVITAALTRLALAEHGVCTLGMFSDNDIARRVYHRLGYQTSRAWSSRLLRRP